MQAPDHDAAEASRVSFKDNKIAYAAFVEPSAVVDHQHVAASSLLQRFQEDVDAAGVSSRDYTPGQAASWNHSVQGRGGAANWGLSANARTLYERHARVLFVVEISTGQALDGEQDRPEPAGVKGR